jgi:hypothetical protein
MSETEPTPEEIIRERAYELWEAAGRPEGRSDEYWNQAQAEFEAEVVREQDAVIDRAREDGAREEGPLE